MVWHVTFCLLCWTMFWVMMTWIMWLAYASDTCGLLSPINKYNPCCPVP